jgi:hypothetical protein
MAISSTFIWMSIGIVPFMSENLYNVKLIVFNLKVYDGFQISVVSSENL